jgi:hypothetical protein
MKEGRKVMKAGRKEGRLRRKKGGEGRNVTKE